MLTSSRIIIVDGNGVTDCGNGSYCCYQLDSCDCSDKSKLFTLDPGNIITTLPNKVPTAKTSASSSTPTSGATGSSSDSDGLSSTASIGVGVGVGIGGLLVLAAICLGVFFCVRKRRRATRAPADQQVYTSGRGYGYSAVGGHGSEQEYHVAEKQGSWINTHQIH